MVYVLLTLLIFIITIALVVYFDSDRKKIPNFKLVRERAIKIEKERMAKQSEKKTHCNLFL